MAKRPSPQEIRTMLQEVRDQYHPVLKIENVEIEISNRLTKTAGHVKHYNFHGKISNFLMTISGPYHDHFGWGSELWETLKHEIIHVAQPWARHSAVFYSEMNRTGAQRYARTRGRDLIPKGQFRCKACGHIFKTADRAQFCPLCDDLVEQIGIIEE